MVKAGIWEIKVSEPYPSWITIKADGREIMNAGTHRDLRDLKHCIKQAMREAKAKMPEQYKDEI